MVTKTPRAVTTRRNSPKTERETHRPSFRSRTNLPRPHRGDPSRRVRTIWEKRTHRSLENQSKLESEGPARMPGNPTAQQTVDAQPQGQPVSTLKAHSEAAAEARRRSPLAKLSDKPDKRAATSHKKRRPTEGGRRITTIHHLEGLAKSERNNQQCKPSFAIKRDKKTLLTQRVTTSQRKTHEEETGEAHKHTRSREDEPSANAQGRPERRRDSHQDQRMSKNKASA